MGERSERGTVARDSADDDDAVATSDLVVRQKDPVFGGVDLLEMIEGQVMLVSLDVDLHPVKRDYSPPPPPPVFIVFASLDVPHPCLSLCSKAFGGKDAHEGEATS